MKEMRRDFSFLVVFSFLPFLLEFYLLYRDSARSCDVKNLQNSRML